MKNIIILTFLSFLGSLAFGQAKNSKNESKPSIQATSQNEVSPIIQDIISKQQVTPEIKSTSIGTGVNETDKQIILKELNATLPPVSEPKIAAYSKDGVE